MISRRWFMGLLGGAAAVPAAAAIPAESQAEAFARIMATPPPPVPANVLLVPENLTWFTYQRASRIAFNAEVRALRQRRRGP